MTSTASEADAGSDLGRAEPGQIDAVDAAEEHAAEEHAAAAAGPRVSGHPDPRLSGVEPVSGPRPVSLLVYSDHPDTRAQVRLAVGRRVAADLPEVAWTECATAYAVIEHADAGGLDLLILDGEAAPVGGMGLCKQLKDEVYGCPPVLVLIGRPQDAWLATWSRADAAVPHPLDPAALAEAVAAQVRSRRAAARG
jgi:CheY-like chemotaxis protein